MENVMEVLEAVMESVRIRIEWNGEGWGNI